MLLDPSHFPPRQEMYHGGHCQYTTRNDAPSSSHTSIFSDRVIECILRSIWRCISRRLQLQLHVIHGWSVDVPEGGCHRVLFPARYLVITCSTAELVLLTMAPVWHCSQVPIQKNSLLLRSKFGSWLPRIRLYSFSWLSLLVPAREKLDTDLRLLCVMAGGFGDSYKWKRRALL
jgi:hypothetical protein